MSTVGILHPGAMGAAIGAALAARGVPVLWASEGRSDATRSRAAGAGLEDSRTLHELVARVDVMVAVCPPEAAADLAHAVAAIGFDGTYVDANAIAPCAARAIAEVVSASGATAIDGGIIGPPPRVAGTTRLYLSGAGAAEVAALFLGTALDAPVVDAKVGSASALKVVYAAYTKGLATLLLALRATARAEGVDDALLAEWAISQPSLAGICDIAAANTGPKAWRWVGEMEQIAATFAAAGLPDGFHLAAAEVCARLEAFKDADPLPTLDAVLDELRR